MLMVDCGLGSDAPGLRTRALGHLPLTDYRLLTTDDFCEEPVPGAMYGFNELWLPGVIARGFAQFDNAA